MLFVRFWKKKQEVKRCLDTFRISDSWYKMLRKLMPMTHKQTL